MIVKIEFDTNTEDGLDDWNMVKGARDFYIAVEDIRSYIRTAIKYNENISDETVAFLEEIRHLLPEVV